MSSLPQLRQLRPLLAISFPHSWHRNLGPSIFLAMFVSLLGFGGLLTRLVRPDKFPVTSRVPVSGSSHPGYSCSRFTGHLEVRVLGLCLAARSVVCLLARPPVCVCIYSDSI